MLILAFALASLLLNSCATTGSPPLATVPSMTCDQRMVEHNRRACQELGKSFEVPDAGQPCGFCR